MAQATTRIHVNDGYGAVGIQTSTGAEVASHSTRAGYLSSPSNE